MCAHEQLSHEQRISKLDKINSNECYLNLAYTNCLIQISLIEFQRQQFVRNSDTNAPYSCSWVYQNSGPKWNELKHFTHFIRFLGNSLIRCYIAQKGGKVNIVTLAKDQTDNQIPNTTFIQYIFYIYIHSHVYPGENAWVIADVLINVLCLV